MADAILKTEGVCKSPLATRPILYTDTIKGEQVCRDDMWAVTTEELNLLQQSLTAEASRLDWAMRHIPGRVFSDLGVTYSAGPDRDAIDAAMTLESANGR